jgi:hypothetical protein
MSICQWRIFAWSHDQEEAFRLPDMFTPSGSYLAKALCDTLPAGVPSSDAAANHQDQRRGLASGGAKSEPRAEPDASSKESHDMPAPIGRYRKRTSRRTTESGALQ